MRSSIAGNSTANTQTRNLGKQVLNKYLASRNQDGDIGRKTMMNINEIKHANQRPPRTSSIFDSLRGSTMRDMMKSAMTKDEALEQQSKASAGKSMPMSQHLRDSYTSKFHLNTQEDYPA